MNELFFKVIEETQDYLMSKSFSRKGKSDFIRKFPKEYKREELISFSFVKSKDMEGVIFIEIIVGIYYPTVKKVEKEIISDFINSYPIISGSAGHFTKENIYTSVPISRIDEIETVKKKLFTYLEEGAFNLFNLFPTIKSIADGILNKNEHLYQYHKFYKLRNLITASCILIVAYGFDKTQLWIEENIKEEDEKKILLIEKLKKMN
jgi:hypothetical protein